MIARTALVLTLLSAIAGPVMAQQDPASAQAEDPYRDQRILPDPADPASRKAPPPAQGEADRRARDARQTQEELRITRALNEETTAQSALEEKADAAARLDYDAALARHQIVVRQAEEQAASAAEADRASQEQYDRDHAAWQEQIRLCQSGFREACTARPAWVRPMQ